MKVISSALTTLVIVLLFGGVALSQASFLQANKEYAALSFARASELYEKSLKESFKDSTARLDAQIKLAHSYMQLRDTRNAERVYKIIAGKKDLSGENSKIYLYYSQALASNNKYDESRDAYDKYDKMQSDDTRGKDFVKLYANPAKLSKNAASYTVDYLDINTNRAEFSPMYYKKGIVFVAARNEGTAVKRVYTWNNTAFLDLYELPDLSVLNNGGSTSSLGGSNTAKKVVKPMAMLGKDEYTSPTPNDSKMVGFGKSNSGTYLEALQPAPIEAKALGNKINSKYHEGPAAFFKDGNKMLFTRNNYSDGKYGQSKEGINKLKLYSAELVSNEWKNIKELPFNNNDYSTGHPTLTKDDKLLYFVSDMPGGFGGKDIYVAKYDNGNWSAPLNMGPTVNTKGDEMFPYVDEKGNLYFSSDGHSGLGDLDIFYVKLIDGVIAKKATNLGSPVNSSKDDFGIITDGERKNGFFSSNRKRGGSDDDIYRFSRSGPLQACQELVVKVIDAETKAPLTNATVELANKDEANGQPKSLKTDGEGNLQLCLDVENDYLFKASNDGYLNNNLGFTTKDLDGSEVSQLEIPLDKIKAKAKTFKINGIVSTQKDKKPIPGVKVILRNECDSTIQEAMTDEAGTYRFEIPVGCDYTIEALKDNFGTMGSKVTGGENTEANFTMFEKGDVIRIDNVYYDLNKWKIRSDAEIELNKLVEMMNKYPKMKIEFGSHTDSRSSAKYNKTLSTKRAKAAVAYIVKKGINTKRIIAAGYGESNPVNKCKDGVPCTEEEYQQNRRTEVKILNL